MESGGGGRHPGRPPSSRQAGGRGGGEAGPAPNDGMAAARGSARGAVPRPRLPLLKTRAGWVLYRETPVHDYLKSEE